MSDAQVWDFATIEAHAAEVQGYSAAVRGLLEEGTAALGRLQAVWQGHGQNSYHAVQTKWNNASDELNSALQNLGMTISEAGQQMAAKEAQVASTFMA
jgi:early secretory antigenic target protein ESAT-6